MSDSEKHMSKRDFPLRREMKQAGPLLVGHIRAGNFPQYAEDDLAFIRCARELWGADTGIHWQCPTHHRLHYVCSGSCFVRHADSEVVAGPGAVVLLPEGIAYQTWVAPERDMNHYIIDFFGDAFVAMMKQLRADGPTVRSARNSEELESLFEHMLVHATRGRPIDWEAALQYLRTIFTVTVCQSRLPHDDTSPAAEHYRNCRDYMDEHYLDLSTYKEVARACGLHHDYLARVFRQYADETPSAYLKRLKMAHAAELLLYSDHSMSEIAEELNYSDAFAFSKAFKQNFHLSPTQWRNQFHRASEFPVRY